MLSNQQNLVPRAIGKLLDEFCVVPRNLAIFPFGLWSVDGERSPCATRSDSGEMPKGKVLNKTETTAHTHPSASINHKRL